MEHVKENHRHSLSVAFLSLCIFPFPFSYVELLVPSLLERSLGLRYLEAVLPCTALHVGRRGAAWT